MKSTKASWRAASRAVVILTDVTIYYRSSVTPRQWTGQETIALQWPADGPRPSGDGPTGGGSPPVTPGNRFPATPSNTINNAAGQKLKRGTFRDWSYSSHQKTSRKSTTLVSEAFVPDRSAGRYTAGVAANRRQPAALHGRGARAGDEWDHVVRARPRVGTKGPQERDGARGASSSATASASLPPTGAPVVCALAPTQ
ncbi:hypothetical protein Aduo_001843 [Ancylostoma duodenale]